MCAVRLYIEVSLTSVPSVLSVPSYRRQFLMVSHSVKKEEGGGVWWESVDNLVTVRDYAIHNGLLVRSSSDDMDDSCIQVTFAFLPSQPPILTVFPSLSYTTTSTRCLSPSHPLSFLRSCSSSLKLCRGI